MEHDEGLPALANRRRPALLAFHIRSFSCSDIDSISSTEQHYEGEMESPNEMMVDAEYVEPEVLDEKDDVAVIDVDQLDSDGALPVKIRADDRMYSQFMAS
jgi:hypothetical protein